MGIRKITGRFGLVAGLALVATTAANASVVFAGGGGTMTAVAATQPSTDGKGTRAGWNVKASTAARTAESVPMKATLEKVSVRDLVQVCLTLVTNTTRSKSMAADDWQSPPCKLANATITDGGKSYELSDVTLVAHHSTGCDGACGQGVADVEINYMAINEKGLPGTKTTTKASAK